MKQLTQKILSNNDINLLTTDEVFTQIPKWGSYYISNHGRLIHKNKKGRYFIVNPSVTSGGYYSYTLSKPARNYNGQKVRDKNGKPKRQSECRTAHRWVAMVYVDNTYISYNIENLDIHHKNHIRTDNYYKNLMWVNRKDHRYIDTIKKISIYYEKSCTYRRYKDIELLAESINITIHTLISNIHDNKPLFKSQDGKWDVYKVNGYFLGLQFYKQKTDKLYSELN